MKKLTLSVFIFMILGFLSHAQDSGISKKMGLGCNLTQYQQDFGIGLNVVSPYFANGKFAVRLRGNLMWNEHLDFLNKEVWSSYANLSLGFTGVVGEIGDFMRLYGEGGTVYLFPSSSFSSESIVFGGYGLFGFEFFFHNQHNYYIEIGGVGTGARADKQASEPIYSNGLLINVGYRFHF